MTQKYRTKLIHEGEYVAQVDVRWLQSEENSPPPLSLEDICKIEEVREDLRKGDLKKAAKTARLFTLRPVDENKRN